MSKREELEPIALFCAEAGLPWDEDRAARMQGYLDLLMQFNEAMNLIGPMGRGEVVRQLLLDSVAAAAARAPAGRILDVGTGAGLPGVPLKILYPGAPISLVEPRQKRSTFLKILVHRLHLQEAKVERCRIEEFDDGEYDYVISKAFEAPAKWLVTAQRFVAPGGAVICMARRKDRDELGDVAQGLGMSLIGSSQAEEDRSAQGRVCYAFEGGAGD